LIARNSNLLLDFPIESRDEIFAFINSPLGKLPAPGMVFSLANQDFTRFRYPENGSNVGSVGGHKES
jgi:hypothetical protein